MVYVEAGVYNFCVNMPTWCLIFDRKELGVALIRIPANIADYESGRKMQAFRTNRKRATKAGYVFQFVKPFDYIHDIMDVNSSM